jgi:hypothetical protein
MAHIIRFKWGRQIRDGRLRRRLGHPGAAGTPVTRGLRVGLAGSGAGLDRLNGDNYH